MEENLTQEVEKKVEQFDPLGDEFLARLPDCIRNAALSVPHDLFGLSESELQLRCYPNAGKRTKETLETDSKLRALFWLEHDLAFTEKRKMILRNVYQDVLLPANFIYSVLQNPRRVAWILTPFGSHIANVAHLLKTGTQRIQEILELPLTRKICRCHWGCMCPKKIRETNGDECACESDCICPTLTDTKVGELIVKIYEKLELRAKGSVPQVINQRINSMNLNYNKNLPPPEPDEQPKTLAEIEEEIKKLEAQMNKPQALPPSREIRDIVEAKALKPTDDKVTIDIAAINKVADNS
jgi:hypothetical protein